MHSLPKAHKGELVVTDLSSELERGSLRSKRAPQQDRERKIAGKQAERGAEKARQRRVMSAVACSCSADSTAAWMQRGNSCGEEVSAVIGVAKPGDDRYRYGLNPVAAWCMAGLAASNAASAGQRTSAPLAIDKGWWRVNMAT